MLSQDKVVDNLITPLGPWQVCATLDGEATGELKGVIITDVVDGVAIFDSMAISRAGSYHIVFHVSRPDMFNISISVTQIEVAKRQLTAEVTPLTAKVLFAFFI